MSDEFYSDMDEVEEQSISRKRGKKKVEKLPEKKKPNLSTEQTNALELCCDLAHRIVGVTGGAGTGKTLVMGHVHRALTVDCGYSVELCAPTGRAAKRISELTGIRARTVHRLLEFPMPDDPADKDAPPNEPKRNRDNPLTCKVVIVDESSMVSPTLFRQLMDALPHGGVIRFFGDNNQLPPVEEGKPPFKDVLERFESVTLTYNFRSEDFIVSNALRILKASVPIRNPQFEVIYDDMPLERLLKFVDTEDKEFADSNHQIIIPGRKSKHGTLRANVALQLKFNPGGKSLMLERYNDNEADLAIKKKDKFVWIKNDYKLNIFNGDMGLVEWIDTEDGSLKVDTSEGSVEVPARLRTYSTFHGHMIDYDPRKQIELGYAITTHKAQGSEFDTVIYCMSQSMPYLLNRANFYTGITRARQRVVVICDRKSMGLSMRAVRR